MAESDSSDAQPEASSDEGFSTASSTDSEAESEPEARARDYRDLSRWTTAVRGANAPAGYPPPMPAVPGPGFRPGTWEARELHSAGGDEALDYWSFVWPQAWTQKIADCTNNYACDKQAAAIARWVRWTPTTALEIQALHAILIFMSIKKNEGGFSGYWQPDPWGEPWVRAMMTKKRFWALMHFIHVAEDADYPAALVQANDRTLKVNGGKMQ